MSCPAAREPCNSPHVTWHSQIGNLVRAAPAYSLSLKQAQERTKSSNSPLYPEPKVCHVWVSVSMWITSQSQFYITNNSKTLWYKYQCIASTYITFTEFLSLAESLLNIHIHPLIFFFFTICLTFISDQILGN